MYPVVAVLHASRRPEVGFSIVQAVMVDMVDELPVTGVHNHPVHRYALMPAFTDCSTSCCVVASRKPRCLPFVFGQAVVVFGVDDGVLSLRQSYSSEGIAVAEAAIPEQSENQETLNKNRN